MLRISNLKLPFDHAEADLKNAILAHLGINQSQLLSYTLARKSTDARKRDEVFFLYQVDVEVADESTLADVKDLKNTPDTEYQFTSPKVQNPADLPALQNDRLCLDSKSVYRPVVIGLGPCG
ncbi:hypothetical protein JYT90_01115, partial [bacterium AH-315-P07]|nr:hypothetical protein [bacterium AH-315-P07]